MDKMMTNGKLSPLETCKLNCDNNNNKFTRKYEDIKR